MAVPSTMKLTDRPASPLIGQCISPKGSYNPNNPFGVRSVAVFKGSYNNEPVYRVDLAFKSQKAAEKFFSDTYQSVYSSADPIRSYCTVVKNNWEGDLIHACVKDPGDLSRVVEIFNETLNFDQKLEA